MNLSADLQNVMPGHPDSDDESDHGQKLMPSKLPLELYSQEHTLEKSKRRQSLEIEEPSSPCSPILSRVPRFEHVETRIYIRKKDNPPPPQNNSTAQSPMSTKHKRPEQIHLKLVGSPASRHSSQLMGRVSPSKRVSMPTVNAIRSKVATVDLGATLDL